MKPRSQDGYGLLRGKMDNDVAKEHKINESSPDFTIKIIVKHGVRTYEQERNTCDQGCNSIDNISSVANYMCKAIKTEIEKDNDF